ncbi:MAG: winged helix DNA-binding protein [Chloroflexi bacterium]|nr:winged helix DNA-binding protein [Chloroflexota bacterium]
MDGEIRGYFQLWGVLHQTAWAIARNRQNELRDVGATFMQAAVMVIVKNVKGPITPAEISRWLFREPQAVSSLLNQMERKGLLKKSKDLERKNMVRVELTEKGEEVYLRSLERTETLREIMSCLTEEERSELEKHLLKLRAQALKTLGAKYRFAPPTTRPYVTVYSEDD